MGPPELQLVSFEFGRKGITVLRREACGGIQNILDQPKDF
jgi:hypothetical protein